jgi:hypothetical protein
MKHEITGPESCELSAFKLPVTDQDTERRNFPGYQTHSFGEDLMDKVSMEGSTETRGGRETNKSHSHAAGELKRRF